jgi:hypothetical protein
VSSARQTYLGQSQLNSPDLSLVSESVLSSELYVSQVPIGREVGRQSRGWPGTSDISISVSSILLLPFLSVLA